MSGASSLLWPVFRGLLPLLFVGVLSAFTENLEFPHKELLSSSEKAKRAMIPYQLSLLTASAIEKQAALFGFPVKITRKGIDIVTL